MCVRRGSPARPGKEMKSGIIVVWAGRVLEKRGGADDSVADTGSSAGSISHVFML